MRVYSFHKESTYSLISAPNGFAVGCPTMLVSLVSGLRTIPPFTFFKLGLAAFTIELKTPLPELRSCSCCEIVCNSASARSIIDHNTV